MNCYFIATITIHYPETYQKYLAGAGAVLRKYKAEVMAVDEHPVVLEGDVRCSRVVLIRFPDKKTAEEWYNSQEYRELAEFRHASSNANAFFVQGRE